MSTERNYALVNEATHVVDNIIVWDGEAEYNPEGYSKVLIPDDSQVGIGYTYIDGEFSSPEILTEE